MNNEFQDRIKQLKATHIAIIYDEDEKQAVFVAPAEVISCSEMNTILTLCQGGITSVAISAERANQLELQPLIRPRTDARQIELSQKYCTTVDARENITTGISVSDRVTTINILGSNNPQPRQLVKPGHVFPIITSTGGTLVKNALPEAALDLITLAEFKNAALFMDILDEHGEFLTDLDAIKTKFHFPVFTISDIVRFRLEHERIIQCISDYNVSLNNNDSWQIYNFKANFSTSIHLALVFGKIDSTQPILVRVQTANPIYDVFGGSEIPTRKRLHDSLKLIKQNGSGIFLYLRPSAYNLLSPKLNCSVTLNTKNLREYGLGAQILYSLGVRKINLLSNSTKNLIGLKSFGIEIISQTAVK